MSRNPLYPIVTILLCGMLLISVFDTGEDADDERIVVRPNVEFEAEIPNVEDWVIDLLEDGGLDWLADAGTLANEVRNAENYGESYMRQRMRGQDFQNADLKGASFRYMEIERSNFRGANLEDALFGLVGLKRSDFRGACLLNARFLLADLEDADFSGAYLVGTEFTSVNDEDANFDDAVFEGEETCPVVIEGEAEEVS